MPIFSVFGAKTWALIASISPENCYDIWLGYLSPYSILVMKNCIYNHSFASLLVPPSQILCWPQNSLLDYYDYTILVVALFHFGDNVQNDSFLSLTAYGRMFLFKAFFKIHSAVKSKICLQNLLVRINSSKWYKRRSRRLWYDNSLAKEWKTSEQHEIFRKELPMPPFISPVTFFNKFQK